jgi:hypothetical protein
MKKLILFTIPFLLNSCSMLGSYDSTAVNASNGIVPTGYQSSGPVTMPGTFGASTQLQSGPSAIAAERATKAKAFWGN